MTNDQPINMEVDSSSPIVKQIGLLLGALVFFGMLFSDAPEGLTNEGWTFLAIALLMAIWWMTEAIPVAATALIPLVAIPLMGLGSVSEAASGFTSKAVFLPLGGFILGAALQRWHLHKRIALKTVSLVGTAPRQVIGGFMVATAFLSMWITNTATTVMMLPIALSVATLLTREGEGSEKEKRFFGVCLMIGIAYAASMGGLMSLVGTSTNVMFKGYFEQNYGIEIGFGQWMQLAVPIGVAMLVLIWFGLTHVIYPCKLKQHDGIHSLITTQLKDMGRLSGGELRTLLVFAVTACMWMFRKPIDNAIAGIGLNDASIAIAAAISLFILPSGEQKGERLLTWKDTKEVPWGILLLLGGGLTVASYLNDTGVADWLGAKMVLLQDMPLWVILLVVTIAIIILSELMSNVATLTAFLPVIIAVAATLGENPLTIAIPAALAASCAFMLPIATPPNAIVFGSGLLRIRHLVKAGVIYNIIGVIIINLLAWMLMPVVYDVVYGESPAWFSTNLQ